MKIPFYPPSRPSGPDDASRPASSYPYFAAFTVLGVTLASLGPSLPYLAENLGVSLAQISYLITSRSLGYLLGSLLGGRLFDRFPGHRVIFAVLILLAGTLALVPVVPQLWALSGVLLLTGIALGGVDVGGNTLLVWRHKGKSGPWLNGISLFAGIGAFAAPVVLARSLLTTGGIHAAYWIFALITLPAAIWVLLLPSPAIRKAEEAGPNGGVNLLLVGLFGFFLFLYIAAEAGFGDWIYTYVLESGLGSDASAALLTSTFWIAITAGRLIAIPAAARFRPGGILAADLAGCLASLALILLFKDSLAAAWVGTVGLGVGMASIFPTTMVLAEQQMHLTGRVTGWIFAGASMGGMVLPWIIGQLMTAAGPHSMMMALLGNFLMAVLVLAALLLFFRRIKQGEAQAAEMESGALRR